MVFPVGAPTVRCILSTPVTVDGGETTFKDVNLSMNKDLVYTPTGETIYLNKVPIEVESDGSLSFDVLATDVDGYVDLDTGQKITGWTYTLIYKVGDRQKSIVFSPVSYEPVVDLDLPEPPAPPSDLKGSLWRGLNKVALGTGVVRILNIGDSYASGVGGTSSKLAYGPQVAKTLREMFEAPEGLYGYGLQAGGFTDLTGTDGDVAANVDFTQIQGWRMNGAASVSWDSRNASSGGVTGPFTAFEVIYYREPGQSPIDVRVDGVSIGSIEFPDVGDELPAMSKTALFNVGLEANHSIELVTTDGEHYIDGFIHYKRDSPTRGVNIISSAGSGFDSDGFNWRAARDGWANLNPHLAMVHLHLNDSQHDRVPQDTFDALTELVQFLKGLPTKPTILLLVAFKTGDETTFHETVPDPNGFIQDDFREKVIEVANSEDVYFIDMRVAVPGGDGSDPTLLDAAHPSNKGHTAYMTAITSWIWGMLHPTPT